MGDIKNDISLYRLQPDVQHTHTLGFAFTFALMHAGEHGPVSTVMA